MGKAKKKWLNVCNTVWAFIMMLLGFTACEQTSADEYGMPYAHYKIKGKVVDPQEKPVSDMQIIIKRMQVQIPINPLGWDTLKTDVKGEFLYDLEAVTEDKFRIEWNDAQNGFFKQDSTDVNMPKPTGGKGWYRGESSKEITINLQEEMDGEDGK